MRLFLTKAGVARLWIVVLALLTLPRGVHAAPPAYEWTQVTLNAAFAGRDGAGALVYDGE